MDNQKIFVAALHIKKSVSIVIPNYNGINLLREYLPYTLAAIEITGVPYELIIVDDCSTDGSVSFIATEYPFVTLIKNDKNSGFSFSCNRGIEAARHELTLLLNSDVKLLPDYFEQQWKYFDKKDTFGVMGRIIDMDNDHIQDAARMPKFNGFKIKTAYFYFSADNNAWLYTLYLSGANALINTAKLKEVGGFLEIFSPFYVEDMELSIRAWRLNWKCYYEHGAVCRHKLSASTKGYRTANWVKSIKQRNRFYFHAIHLNGINLAAWYLQITLIDLLPRLLAGQLWIWNSYKELFRNQASINKCKITIKKLMDNHDSETTLFKAVEFIQASIKNKPLRLLK